MMKTLVIAEKPSVGRDIARVLDCNKKNSSFIEGTKYVVTWGLGHLVTLSDPEEYSPDYKTWNLALLPMLPSPMKLSVIKQTGKQFHAVKNLIHRKDINEIVIATDAGREGELVARWILEKSGNKKPTKRLWISSVTDKAIKDGFAHLKNGRDYDNLYRAALCRAQADWLVGINATRALTCKYNAQLSCGRVQTPTLSLIALREEEIKRFKPKAYYGLQVLSNGVVFTWKDLNSFDEEFIKALNKKLENKEAKVVSVQKKKHRQLPPLLYDLTSLQQDANKRYQYSAKQTLNIMQRLYENHKVLTYPRTDSRYITKDVLETLKERLQAINIGPYKAFVGPLFKTPLKGNASFVNDEKVTDHHAIIPTEQFVRLDHMTTDEKRIYDLVVRRFLSVLYPAYEYEQTTITLKIEDELFTAKGIQVLDLGWKKLYESEIEKSLPDFKEGDLVSVSKLKITKGQTNPPSPFTEATLLAVMESDGLGTVATRADIIEKLFSSFLLEKRGNFIYTTAKARQLLELVPKDLKQPELTAKWELKLSKISEGKLKDQAFMNEIRDYATSLTEQIKTGEGTFRHENLTNKVCSVCGKKMLAVKNKNSEMLVCQDRECNYREVISRTSNARCPKCHKKMQLYGKGDAQVFTCVCGYKEKLEHFKDRRKKEGAGVSKKDVQNYLKKQNKSQNETLNTSFADALSAFLK